MSKANVKKKTGPTPEELESFKTTEFEDPRGNTWTFRELSYMEARRFGAVESGDPLAREAGLFDAVLEPGVAYKNPANLPFEIFDAVGKAIAKFSGLGKKADPEEQVENLSETPTD